MQSNTSILFVEWTCEVCNIKYKKHNGCDMAGFVHDHMMEHNHECDETKNKFNLCVMPTQSGKTFQCIKAILKTLRHVIPEDGWSGVL